MSVRRRSSVFRSPVALCIGFFDLFFIVLVEERLSFASFFSKHSLGVVNDFLTAARRPVDFIVFGVLFIVAGLIDQSYRKKRGRAMTTFFFVVEYILYLSMFVCYYFYPSQAALWLFLTIVGVISIDVIDMQYRPKKNL